MNAVLTIVGVVTAFILKGVAISYGWSLFVVPFGVMSITVVHALGISSVISLFTVQFIDEESSFRKSIIHSILLSVVSMVFMFVYSQFM